MIICPQCGYNSNEQHNFCPSCGYDLRQINVPEQEKAEITETSESKASDLVICNVCGEETPLESGYCTSCGAVLTGKEQKAEKTARSEVIPEKKQPPAEIEKKELQDKPLPPKTEPATGKTPSVKKTQPKPKAQAAKNRTQKSGVANQAGQQKSITQGQIAAIIAGILVLGAFILYVSGVFGTGNSNNAADNTAANAPSEQKPKISLEDFQRLNDLENAVKKDSSNMTTVLELAHGLNDAGRYQDAIKYYNLYLRNNSRNVDVLVDQGVCYFELKRYPEAKSTMRKALQINPRHQIGNFNLGIVNFSSGNLDSAKLWWKKAIEIDPNTEIGKKSKDLLDSN